MAKVLLEKSKASLVEGITEFEGNVYCLHLKGYEDAIWCKSSADIYITVEQFHKTGMVKTNEYSEVVY